MADKKQVPVMDRVKEYMSKVAADGYEAHRFDDAADFREFLGRELDRFPEYVQAVVRYDNGVSLAYATMEGEDLRDKVQNLDRGRRMAHDCAISAVNILNRAFGRAGLEPFADIDTSDRHAVADFAGRFTIEAFDRQVYGEDHAMDRAVQNAKAGSKYTPSMQAVLDRVAREDAADGRGGAEPSR